MIKLLSILLFSAFLAVASCLKHDLNVTMGDQQFEKQIANMSVTLRHSNRYHEFNWKAIIAPNSNHSKSVDYVFRFNEVHEVLFKWKSYESTTLNNSHVYLKYIYVIPAYYGNPKDRDDRARRFCPNVSDQKVIYDHQVTLYPCP